MNISSDVLYVGSDNVFEVSGLKSEETGAYINDATIELTLLDGDDAEIAGQSWPLTVAYVAGSNGVYRGVIQDTAEIVAGETGTARVVIDASGVDAQLDIAMRFVERTQASVAWTSRAELERMFGLLSVKQWADLDGTDDADAISSRIQDVCDDATVEARDYLKRSSVRADADGFTPSRSLRMNVTRLAGALLYDGRGTVDTADPEGKHRLSATREMAVKWFRRVQANQVQIDDEQAASVPSVVDALTLWDVWDSRLSVSQIIFFTA